MVLVGDLVVADADTDKRNSEIGKFMQRLPTGGNRDIAVAKHTGYFRSVEHAAYIDVRLTIRRANLFRIIMVAGDHDHQGDAIDQAIQ